MKDFVVDAHSHTIASGHAYGTIREMALGAKENGIKLLGITEHGQGIPATCPDIYMRNLKATAPEVLFGVEMLYGIEANIMNDGTINTDEKVLKTLDYAIAGIHMLCYKDEGIEKNTDNVISAMKNPKVYFISHPDDDHTPLNYERLVAAAKQYHVALEVNSSSFRKQHSRLNCVENYRKMCALCKDMGVYIVVNSDAHDPNYVGHQKEAREFLEEISFPEELILNNDVDKFKEFINFNKETL